MKSAAPAAIDLRVKLSAEAFECDDDPGAWSATADDREVAVNRRQASGVIRGCKKQLRTTCQILDANGQIEPPGSCPEPPKKKAPE